MKAMCEFKSEEHKITQSRVRDIAREVVWNNTPAAIAEDAAAVTSAYLVNSDRYRPSYVDGVYWQPDLSNTYADRHLLTDEQFARLVSEVDKQAQRVSKLLSHPRTAA
jgi:hypothetical protein